jgi:hypothetical protein
MINIEEKIPVGPQCVKCVKTKGVLKGNFASPVRDVLSSFTCNQEVWCWGAFCHHMKGLMLDVMVYFVSRVEVMNRARTG